MPALHTCNKQTCYCTGKLFQLKANSPVVTRALHQTCSAVTVLQVTALIDSPATCVCSFFKLL